jgi:hypothetical protein
VSARIAEVESDVTGSENLLPAGDSKPCGSISRLISTMGRSYWRSASPYVGIFLCNTIIPPKIGGSQDATKVFVGCGGVKKYSCETSGFTVRGEETCKSLQQARDCS